MTLQPTYPLSCWNFLLCLTNELVVSPLWDPQTLIQIQTSQPWEHITCFPSHATNVLSSCFCSANVPLFTKWWTNMHAIVYRKVYVTRRKMRLLMWARTNEWCLWANKGLDQSQLVVHATMTISIVHHHHSMRSTVCQSCLHSVQLRYTLSTIKKSELTPDSQ